MSRVVQTRYVVSGVLKAMTPLHIGGVEGDPSSDLPLCVDGSGNFYLPGTSLAGALRGECQLLADFALVEAVWGRIPPMGSSTTGHASLIMIEDATLLGSIVAEIRDGVGIDRYSGRAAGGIKFDRQILPKGTTFKLELTFDELADGPGPEMLGRLVCLLSKDGIRLGGAKSRGLGRVCLMPGFNVEKQELNSRDWIIRRLKGELGQPDQDDAGLTLLGVNPNADIARPQLCAPVRK